VFLHDQLFSNKLLFILEVREMKKKILLLLVLVVSASVSASVILNEPFNYADNPSLNAVWNGFSSNPDYTLDTTFGNGEPSYMMPSPSGNFQGRLAYNLGGDYNGTDAQPLQFSIDMYLPETGASTLWNGSRHFVELRGYSGDAYGSGGLENIIALGLNNASGDAFSNQFFQARIFLGGDWYTLDANAGTPGRTVGWHTLAAKIKSTSIDFYVDGVLAETLARANGLGFDNVVLGSDLTANGNTVWVDNILVETVPEPATLLLLGAGGFLLRRRK
jgi:hypothetical protein